MTNAQSIRIAGKSAIIAALMGGSSLAFAQDAVPVTVAPPTPSPVAAVPSAGPVIVPPPAVSTLPTANDVVNATAAQEAAAEANERRNAAAAARTAPTVRPVTRPAPAVNAVPTSTVAPNSADAADLIAPDIDSVPVPATVEQDPMSVAAAPVTAPDSAQAEGAGMSGEDLTLVGGIAAALAALGLGAAFVSRRKRKVVANDRQPQMGAHRDFVAPAPINQDPVFQQFAAQPTSAQPTVVAPASERLVQPKPVMTRPDIPVTDPLFSRTVVQTPITDPLFAPRNDVEIPITDPMFAHLSDYEGNSGGSKSTWAFDNRQNRNKVGKVTESISPAMEPAE